jgi:tripartite-type tricarboxylate transporter receptor subunit TctC
MNRRAFIAVATGTLCLGSANSAVAQVYPSRPIQLIVPFSAGSSTDIVARGLASEFAAQLGQPLVVMNREGASGTIALTAAANAAPDGYTLVLAPQGPLTIQPVLKPKLPYRADTFQPICQVFEDAFAIFVGSNSPIVSFNDLVTRSRDKPKSLTFGSSGVATVPHLQMEGIARAAGIAFVHAPYRAYGQMMPNILSGTLDFAIAPIAVIRGASVHVLSVIGAARSAIYPDAPTMKELGYPVASPGIGGLYAHKAAPGTVHDLLEQVCSKTLASPAFQQMVTNTGTLPSFLPRDEFAKRLEQDGGEMAALIRAIGFVIE